MSSSRPETSGPQAQTSGPDPQTRGPGGLDVRLLLPALLAWSLGALLLGRDGVTRLIVAASLAVAGAVLTALLAQWRAGSPWSAQVALSTVAGVLVLTASSAHAGIDRAGVVPALAEDGAQVRVEAVVLTEPRVVVRGDERADLVVLRLRVEQVRSRGLVSTPRTPVLVLAEAGDGWEGVRWHSRVRAGGRLSVPEQSSGDVVAVLAPRGPPEVVRGPTLPLRAADHARNRLREAVDPLPADPRGLIPGLVIGDTSLTPPELTEAMLDTGMSHLSAVSGSNVAIVLGAVMVVCGWSGVPRAGRPVLALVALVAFVVLCRPEPSVLRAGVMGLVGLLALSASRRRASLPALAVAVLVLLCVDPALARSYGFALSTLATLGLVLFARPWGDAIACRLPRRARLMGDAVAIPLAAQVVCAPVIVLLQGSISTVAVLANLLAAPFVAPTTVAGILTAVLGVLWPPLAVVGAWVGALPAWAIGRVARVCARVPLGQVDWVDGAPGAFLLAALTLALVVTGPWLRLRAARRPLAVVALLGCLGGLMVPLPGGGGWPPRGWVVLGCDVGQGDAFLVPTGPGRAVLVDTGAEPEPVAGCLRRAGVHHLDALVLSHFHADHVAGLPGVLQEVGLTRAYVSPVQDPPEEARRTLAALAEAGVPTQEVHAGDLLVWGGVQAAVLWPEPSAEAELGANDASIVLDLQVQGVRVLLTGDIETRAAAGVRRAMAGQEVDVLKVAHHGSAEQDRALVDQLSADVALIGVGADNTFGHPTASALSLVRRAGAVVLRTDLHGDVAVLVRDGVLSVATSRGRRRPPPGDRGGPSSRPGTMTARRVVQPGMVSSSVRGSAADSARSSRALAHRASRVALMAGTRCRSGVVTTWTVRRDAGRTGRVTTSGWETECRMSWGTRATPRPAATRPSTAT